MAKKLTFTRYLWFIDQARKQKHPNTRTLAEKYEISPVQAQRDIEFIRDQLCAPLNYVAAKKGYELTDHAFSLPSVWVEDEELLLLAIAKELIRDPDSRKILDGFVHKIAINSSQDLAEVERYVSYKGMGSYRQRSGILSQLLDALLLQRKVEILFMDYWGHPEKSGWRTITPCHLLFYRTNWYVLARDRDKLRTFTLARIEQVRLLEEAAGAAMPVQEIRELIDDKFGIFITDTDNPVVQVKLRFLPEIAQFTGSVVFHPAQQVEECADGSLTVTFPSTINRELIGEVLRFADQVEILEPPELKDELRAILRRGLINLGS